MHQEWWWILFSSFSSQSEKINRLLNFQDRIKGTFQLGFTWISEMKSQEVLIAHLNRVLDKQFTLLRNVPLPDGGVTIPLILLGPHGVTVIYNSPLRGIYRAQGDSWEIMDNRMRNFKPTKPTLFFSFLSKSLFKLTSKSNNFFSYKF